MSTSTAELRKRISELKKSERGQAALKNLEKFAQEGGTGLDDMNKTAAMHLFAAILTQPWDLPAEFMAK